MANPINELFEITEILTNLDHIQDTIDIGRAIIKDHPDADFAAFLDDAQMGIDFRRMELEQTMEAIAQQN